MRLRGGDRRGLVRCDVKYSKDLSINEADTDSLPQVVSTLLTSLCVRRRRMDVEE